MILAALVVLGITGFFLAKNNIRSLQPEGERVYATFDGGEIKAKEVLEIIQIDPSTDPDTIQKVRIAATMQKVKRRLLEIEAAKQKISAEDLVAKLSADLPAVSDEEVQKILVNQGKNPKKLNAKDLEVTRRQIQNQKISEAGARYMDELYKKSNVHIYIEK